MTVHRLKCWPDQFEAVNKKIKSFELRKNDRNFFVGDIVRLCEYNPKTATYSGREIDQRIRYILTHEFCDAKDEYALHPAYVVLGF